MSPPLITCHLTISNVKQVTLSLSLSLMHCWLDIYYMKLLPVFCYQAVKKDGHLCFGEICSNTKSHATPKSHEMFGCAIHFHSLFAIVSYKL